VVKQTVEVVTPNFKVLFQHLQGVSLLTSAWPYNYISDVLPLC